MENKKYKRWAIGVLAATICMLLILGGVTVFIDPCFHYHKPLDRLAYQLKLKEERYINDGIARNFEYTGIISGTSMVENFKTSEFDGLFYCNSVKVPYSGGKYKLVSDTIRRGLENNPDVSVALRSLDYSAILDTEDGITASDPGYLMNDNPFDDVNYVFNKDILFDMTFATIYYTRAGMQTTSFDDYANWNAMYSFGKDAVLSTYARGEKKEEERIITEEEKNNVIQNIRENIVQLANDYPDTTFYAFFTPYSICYWDSLNQAGEVNWHIELERYAIEEMINVPNLKLFSFSNNFDLICNLDNYKDQAHYSEAVNSAMLHWMQKDEYLLTADNYESYLSEIQEFYTSYNYDEIYQ